MQINQQIVILALGVFGLFILILGYLVFDIRQKFAKLFKGDMAESHIGMLTQLLHRQDVSERDIADIARRLLLTEGVGRLSFQKVGFVRFNPFSDTGGDQSFALALLDKENNGIVLSSLYNRDGTRVYAKAISGGSSKQALSGEESQVLRQAMNV